MNRLRQARKAIKLTPEQLKETTQEQLASILKVKQRTISAWECGRNPISESVALLIQGLFGINHVWLLHGEGEMWIKDGFNDNNDNDGGNDDKNRGTNNPGNQNLREYKTQSVYRLQLTQKCYC